MRRPPLSTYRLQLHKEFRFDDAAKASEYLKELGVSHVYCSPYLQAAPGSTHGYDVVDHERLNEELGGEHGHAQFCRRLRELGLGQVLDIVPNHMAIGPQNRNWWDVLENGPSSRFSTWFDIDWHSAEVKLRNKVLIPVLGDQYGRILSAGQIRVEQDSKQFQVHYADNVFPLSPHSLWTVLSKAAEYANNDTLGLIADSFARLPATDSSDLQIALARHRDKTVIYGLLNRLCEEEPHVVSSIERSVNELNEDFNSLDELLNQQHYRLAYWRTADQELGYRRFFDINTLIGLRMERAHVFEATHRRILEWIENGILDGIRVDHPDGLRDPRQYFERLRGRAPDAWIIGEKILEPEEYLRENWPIEGTTGYDFLNICNGLLVNTNGLKALAAVYSDFTRETVSFKVVAHDKKLDVLQESLGSDINRLTSLFVEICENNRDRRDYTRAEIRRALREVASCFSVYRTYVIPVREEILDEDRIHIDNASAEAKARRQDVDGGLFDFIADVLTLRVRGEMESEFLLRFQQLTSPVMAKGVEDTALYCFNRMVGLNEVGSVPGNDGLTITEFHDYCARMQVTRPLTMTALSTHDTKRAEDVRARLAVLTESPAEWRTAVYRWSRANAPFRTGKFPDRNTEYLLYQTLVGAWPISRGRLTAYMEKATREAKQQTSWTQHNTEFEEALRIFIERILESKDFMPSLERFVDGVKQEGRINSLAQTLLKYTAPGVPDTYQGTELWDLSLVDPDNRRPVDYDLRQRMLSELKRGIDVKEILLRMDDGLPKLWVSHRAMCLRREHPEWFGAESTYLPIVAEGSKADYLVGYQRGDNVAVFVPRWSLKLNGSWGSTTVDLAPGRWKNILTNEVVIGGRLRIQNVLRQFPVALLTREVE